MALFVEILMRVTLPICVLVALGWLLQGRLKLDVASLNRLQVYVVLPCFLVHFLSAGAQPLSAVWQTAYFTVVQFMFLIPMGWLLALAFRLRRGLGPVVGLATAYANVGFFGIPVTQLAFGADYLIHQSVITALTAIMIVTVGVWLLAPSAGGVLARLKSAFATPMIPAVVLGLSLRGVEVTLPPLVGIPIQMIGSIFTPLALYTLGAQLAQSSLGAIRLGPQTLMLVLKFLLAPVVTWALAYVMDLPKDLTALLVVAASTPVGVLITVFCAEYRRDPEFINAAVVISTALSPLVVTAWILIMRSV
ncbi:MAG: AEC family transporter [Hyphomicrobiaceae bacterium]|nr:AEC family transporter [Hyphomicrobiaceae bacterium]